MAMDTTAGSDVYTSSPMSEGIDDVFGSASGSPTGQAFQQTASGVTGNTEFSDIPRLQQTHETAGYRDGITQGKRSYVQRGFDEGFGLGAKLGLRVGRIHGILQGIEESLLAPEATRVGRLRLAAEEELAMPKIYDKMWWDSDGSWTYAVVGAVCDEDNSVITYDDVARAHPLLKKWDDIVAEEIAQWHVDLFVLDKDPAVAGLPNSTADKNSFAAQEDNIMALSVHQAGKKVTGAAPGDLALIKDDLNW
ncbi:ABC1 domain containing protein/yae1 [Blumeria hordei DH14]|uniref:Protein YAE1 n=1 Tax=Blumeria graminis f. sp. hordei (strain DH14) TaxID=546991 RepID=N1JN57_BLUG1|nr:ABC1 domain containing protein/yae1 [Blumeria hordei DH14]